MEVAVTKKHGSGRLGIMLAQFDLTDKINIKYTLCYTNTLSENLFLRMSTFGSATHVYSIPFVTKSAIEHTPQNVICDVIPCANIAPTLQSCHRAQW